MRTNKNQTSALKDSKKEEKKNMRNNTKNIAVIATAAAMTFSVAEKINAEENVDIIDKEPGTETVRNENSNNYLTALEDAKVLDDVAEEIKEEAKKDYERKEEEVAKTEKEIEEATKELNHLEEEAQNAFDDVQKNADKEYQEAIKEYNSAENELNTAEASVNETEKDIEDAKEEVDQKQAALEEAEKEIGELTVNEIDNLENDVNLSKQEYEAEEALVDAQNETIRNTKQEITETEAELNQAKETKEESQSVYDEALKDYEDKSKTTESAKNEYEKALEESSSSDVYSELNDSLNAAVEEYQQQESVVNDVQGMLEESYRNKEEAEATLREAESELEDKEKECEIAKGKLESAESDLNARIEDFEKAEKYVNETIEKEKEADVAVGQAVQNKEDLESAKAEAESLVTNVDNRIVEVNNSIELIYKQIDDINKQITKGSYGFFEWHNSGSALDVLDRVMTFQNSSDTTMSESMKTVLGATKDATSLENMKAALDYVVETNRLRQADEYSTGENKNPLMVSDYLMAIAQVNANASAGRFKDSNEFNHWDYLWNTDYFGENIALGYANPYDGWYDAEKELFEKGNNNFYEIGHYLNLINPTDRSEMRYRYTGVAINRATYKFSGQTFSSQLKNDEKAYTIEEYRNDIDRYLKEINDALVSRQGELNDAKSYLAKLQQDKMSAEADVQKYNEMIINATVSINLAQEDLAQKKNDSKNAQEACNTVLSAVNDSRNMRDINRTAYEEAIREVDNSRNNLDNKKSIVEEKQVSITEKTLLLEKEKQILSQKQEQIADIKTHISNLDNRLAEAEAAYRDAIADEQASGQIVDAKRSDLEEKIEKYNVALKKLESLKTRLEGEANEQEKLIQQAEDAKNNYLNKLSVYEISKQIYNRYYDAKNDLEEARTFYENALDNYRNAIALYEKVSKKLLEAKENLEKSEDLYNRATSLDYKSALETGSVDDEGYEYLNGFMKNIFYAQENINSLNLILKEVKINRDQAKMYYEEALNQANKTREEYLKAKAAYEKYLEAEKAIDEVMEDNVYINNEPEYITHNYEAQTSNYDNTHEHSSQKNDEGSKTTIEQENESGTLTNKLSEYTTRDGKYIVIEIASGVAVIGLISGLYMVLIRRKENMGH